MSGYQHILVTIDLSPNYQKVLDKAVARAKANQAKLSIVHVNLKMQSLYNQMYEVFTHKLEDKPLLAAKKELEQMLASVDYPLEKQILISGDLVEQICEAVRLCDADLLICGHEHHLFRQNSSVAHQLIENINCDLLVIPLEK